VDWFRKVGIGSFIVIFFWIISGTVQFAYAENIFDDTFTMDPALNQWTEDYIRIPVLPFPSTATGDVRNEDGMDAVLLKVDGIGRVEVFIIREIDTTGFENISFNLAAFQTHFPYQVPDLIRIQYDAGEGFVTLLEDHQVWNGKHDLDGDGEENLPGNTVSTSTGDLVLPSIADDNPSLKIRLSAVIDAIETNTVFFDNFQVNGEPLVLEPACDLLEEFYAELEDLNPSQIKNPGEWVSKAANLLELLEGADKETHALFIKKFHEYKELLKEKLSEGKQQGSFENKIIGNNLDKEELKLKIQSSKILENNNKINKIQTAVDLGNQKEELIKIKNLLGVAQHLNKSPEKDKLIEQLKLEKIELLKGVLILDAKHNDKKITTDFLKKLDEKIIEEIDGGKSQNDKKQDDKGNNSKKSDNKNKGNSSKSNSKNK